MKRIVSILLLCVWALSCFASAIEAMDVNSAASILIDASDGHEIYSENADSRQFPASITKLMTALLVIENVDNLDEVAVANETAFKNLSDAGSSVGIKPGEEMSVNNLLICMLVASANEAANILAEHVSGSVEAFVDLMNARAEELGLEGTHFCNPNGLHEDEHYTTARDLTKIAMEVRKHEKLLEICNMEMATIPATNIGKERFFYTTNSLISLYKERGYKYSRANGMKTGSTSKAGLCLVASAEYNGTELISVVLGAEKDESGNKGNFTESKRLLVWGFENFKTQTLLSSSKQVCEVKVKSAKDRDYVVGHIPESYSVMMPKDFDSEKVELIKTTEKELEAPVNKGDKIGTVLIRYEGRDYVTLPVVAADTVERSTWEYIKNQVKAFFDSPMAIIIIIAAILIALCIIKIIQRKKRKRRKRRRYYR